MLADYAARLPQLQLRHTFTDPFEAMRYLQQQPVDLLFLDIQMPDLSGFQLLNTLQSLPPALVFTTAYRQFGVEGFNVDAVDYLLKPYDFERFAKAVNKALDWVEARGKTPAPAAAPPAFIFIKSEHQLVKVRLEEIRWLEAWGDYVKVYTGSDKPLLTLTNLSVFAEVLPADAFVRVHRSFIVQLGYITLIQRNRIFIGAKNIPVGDAYAEAFYRKLPEL